MRQVILEKHFSLARKISPGGGRINSGGSLLFSGWEALQTLDVEIVQRFYRFAICGFSGVFVHMGIIYVLQEFFSIKLIYCAVIAIEMAVINNFLLNEFWTFRDISKQQVNFKKRCKRFLKFNVVSFSGLLLNLVITGTLHTFWSLNVYMASLIAIGFVTFWNFGLNLKYSWSAK